MDFDQLKRMHFNILTEIVQATTLCNVQAAKGYGSSEFLDQTQQDKENASGYDQVARYKRYIGQLVQAKTLCDNRIRYLEKHNRTTERKKSDENRNDPEGYMTSTVIGQQCISLAFDSIMRSPFSRRYFYSYLEQHGNVLGQDGQRSANTVVATPYQDLLGFWAAVEELRSSDKKIWHQLATEIFYTYINKPQDPKKVIAITRNDLKKIESFLVGDTGPDVFYKIQDTVLNTLKTEHYPSFLVSETCYKMLENAQEHEITLQGGSMDGFVKTKSEATPLIDLVVAGGGRTEAVGSYDPQASEPSSRLWDNQIEKELPFDSKISIDRSSDPILISNFSNFAKSHLEHIGERLQNKTQALKALKSSLKPDSKVSSKVSKSR